MASGEKGNLVDSSNQGGDMPPAYDEVKETGGGGDSVPEVKITSDTKIDMGNSKEQDQGFQGLSKEELMKYANDPFWVRLRWILFILFWAVWVAMLVASVVIIVYAEKCPSPEPKSWWQKSPVYKVDLDNEATSLKEIAEDKTLNYLVESGVATLYLSSFYPSASKDTSSDLENLKTIGDKYGTMDDWKALLAGLKERDQKILIDFIPNYSDLDLQNPEVLAKLEEVLKFWLETGVDGFVTRDLSPLVDKSANDTKTLVSVLDTFRAVLDNATAESGSPKVLTAIRGDVTTADAAKLMVNATGNNVGRPLHLIFSDSWSTSLVSNLNANNLKKSFDNYIKTLPTNVWPTLSFNSLDFGPELADAFIMFKMMVPATSIFSAGEELGLASLDMTKAEEQNNANNESHLKLFKTLAQKLRHQDAILFGELNTNSTFVKDENVFGMTRVKKGNPGYLLLINFGDTAATVDVSKVEHLSDNIRVMAKSVVEPFVPGEISSYDSKAVTVEPKEGKIFTFVPKFKKK